jgi:sugar/nucleoside kinase (ribokinase family)
MNLQKPNSTVVLALGAPLIDQVLLVPEEFVENLPGEKGGSGMIDHETLQHLLDVCEIQPVIAAGGSTSNTVKGMAELGIKCAIVGKIGDDAHGKIYKDQMHKHGVYPLFHESETPTGQVLCFVTPDGQRTMRSYLGASLELEHHELHESNFEGIELFHLASYSFYNQDLTKQSLDLAKEAGAKISLDLASFEVVETFHEKLHYYLKHYVDIVFANEDEARALTGKSEKDTCSYLAQFCEIAVVSMGKNGCWVAHEGELHFCSALPEEPVDTTGAGDLFVGGFLTAYLEGKSVKECAHYGSVTGAAVVKVIGASLPEETWDAIREKLNRKGAASS